MLHPEKFHEREAPREVAVIYAPRSGTLVRFYLAAMNQVPWDCTTALPVEWILTPDWLPVNIYELSSWARGTLGRRNVRHA